MSVLRSVSIRSRLSWRNRASISSFVTPAAATPSLLPSTPSPPASRPPPPLSPPSATGAPSAAESSTSCNNNLPSYWPRLSSCRASCSRFSVTRCSSPYLRPKGSSLALPSPTGPMSSSMLDHSDRTRPVAVRGAGGAARSSPRRMPQALDKCGGKNSQPKRQDITRTDGLNLTWCNTRDVRRATSAHSAQTCCTSACRNRSAGRGSSASPSGSSCGPGKCMPPSHRPKVTAIMRRRR